MTTTTHQDQRLTALLNDPSARHITREADGRARIERRGNSGDWLEVVRGDDGWVVGGMAMSAGDALAFVELFVGT